MSGRVTLVGDNTDWKGIMAPVKDRLLRCVNWTLHITVTPYERRRNGTELSTVCHLMFRESTLRFLWPGDVHGWLHVLRRGNGLISPHDSISEPPLG